MKEAEMTPEFAKFKQSAYKQQETSAFRPAASVGCVQRSWGRPVLLVWYWVGLLGGQPRMGAFVRLRLRGGALSFFLYSFQAWAVSCPPLSFIARTCFALRSQSGVLVA